MGEVYLAEHPLLGKKVAVKVLLPQLSQNPQHVQRFFNEARAAALVGHSGIVDVFDFGQLADGSAFLIMQFLEGRSLATQLKNGRMPVPLMIEIDRQIASAVGAAHDRGIVHRDLKPDNIFLMNDSDQPWGVRVKLLDFGIAKLQDETQSGVHTNTGVIMGSPMYMSPEQCRGAGAVDHRADIYSLGCTMFEMATGRAPFVAAGAGEVIGAHLFAPPPALQPLAPHLPVPLVNLIEQMLRKAPGERPQSMAEIVNALGAMSASQPRHTPMPGEMSSVLPGASGPITTLGGAAMATVGGGGRTFPWKTLVVAFACIVALGVGMALTMVGPSPSVTMEMPDLSSPVAVHPISRDLSVPPPRMVRLRIQSAPAGAGVYRAADGGYAGRTPLDLDVPHEDGETSFVLKMSGHYDQPVSLRVDRDDEVRIAMKPRASGKKAVPPPPDVQPESEPRSQDKQFKLLDPFEERK